MSLTLEIYTMRYCLTYDMAQETARDIAARLPEITVAVYDLEDEDVTAPPEVFSVPTYLLNGTVISLGNPYLDQLEAKIRRQFERG